MIDSLWYNDIDNTYILKKQLSLKKDAKERFKKMNKLGFSRFLDHMLTQNMCNMANMAFAKKVFAS